MQASATPTIVTTIALPLTQYAMQLAKTLDVLIVTINIALNNALNDKQLKPNPVYQYVQGYRQLVEEIFVKIISRAYLIPKQIENDFARLQTNLTLPADVPVELADLLQNLMLAYKQFCLFKMFLTGLTTVEHDRVEVIMRKLVSMQEQVNTMAQLMVDQTLTVTSQSLAEKLQARFTADEMQQGAALTAYTLALNAWVKHENNELDPQYAAMQQCQQEAKSIHIELQAVQKKMREFVLLAQRFNENQQKRKEQLQALLAQIQTLHTQVYAIKESIAYQQEDLLRLKIPEQFVLLREKIRVAQQAEREEIEELFVGENAGYIQAIFTRAETDKINPILERLQQLVVQQRQIIEDAEKIRARAVAVFAETKQKITEKMLSKQYLPLLEPIADSAEYKEYTVFIDKIELQGEDINVELRQYDVLTAEVSELANGVPALVASAVNMDYVRLVEFNKTLAQIKQALMKSCMELATQRFNNIKYSYFQGVVESLAKVLAAGEFQPWRQMATNIGEQFTVLANMVEEVVQRYECFVATDHTSKHQAEAKLMRDFLHQQLTTIATIKQQHIEKTTANHCSAAALVQAKATSLATMQANFSLAVDKLQDQYLTTANQQRQECLLQLQTWSDEIEALGMPEYHCAVDAPAQDALSIWTAQINKKLDDTQSRVTYLGMHIDHYYKTKAKPILRLFADTVTPPKTRIPVNSPNIEATPGPTVVR